MNQDQQKQIHIVLDLEAMGTKQDAAIIEIGMVIFNHMGQEGTVNVIEQWSRAINLENSMMRGGTISPGTIEWWMNTDQTEARDNWIASPKQGIHVALNTVAARILNYSAINPLPLIWSNGVNFAKAILKSAYERLEVKVPWGHRQDADFRTLKLLYKELVPEPAFVGTPHIALDDARHEAVWLSQILQYIYGADCPKGIPGRPMDISKLNLTSPKIMESAEASLDFKIPFDSCAKN